MKVAQIRTMKVKRPLRRQGKMFGTRIKIMWEEQLFKITHIFLTTDILDQGCQPLQNLVRLWANYKQLSVNTTEESHTIGLLSIQIFKYNILSCNKNKKCYLQFCQRKGNSSIKENYFAVGDKRSISSALILSFVLFEDLLTQNFKI